MSENDKVNGAKGGSVRSELKRRATRQNLAKARQMKLLYRLNPSTRRDATRRDGRVLTAPATSTTTKRNGNSSNINRINNGGRKGNGNS